MKPEIYPPYLTDTNVFDYWKTWPSGIFCQRYHIFKIIQKSRNYSLTLAILEVYFDDDIDIDPDP